MSAARRLLMVLPLVVAAGPYSGDEPTRETCEGIIRIGPTGHELSRFVTVFVSDSYAETHDLAGCVPVWHLDHGVRLSLADLTPGTRVRFATEAGRSNDGAYNRRLVQMEVVSLGPYALAAAVEDWVAEASGDRPDKALSPGELATLGALGSASALVRDATTRALGDRGIRALRLLVWARRARDPEVHIRAELLLKKLGWLPPVPAPTERNR